MSVALAMSKTNSLKYLAVVVLVIVVSLFTIDLNRYADKIARIISYRAMPLGIKINFESPQLSALSFSAKKMGIAFPASMISTTINDASLNANLFSALLLKPTIKFSGFAYDGTISGKITHHLSDATWKIEYLASDLDLSKHPQLMGFGLLGKLSILDSSALIYPDFNRESEFHLSVKEGSKPESTKVNLEPFGAPFTITTPAIKRFDIGIDGKLENNHIKDLEVALTSSLGNLNMIGELWLSKRDRIERVKLALSVALTEDGKRELGTVLVLASGGQLKNSTTEFKVSFDGPAHRPTINYYDIQ